MTTNTHTHIHTCTCLHSKYTQHPFFSQFETAFILHLFTYMQKSPSITLIIRLCLRCGQTMPICGFVRHEDVPADNNLNNQVRFQSNLSSPVT